MCSWESYWILGKVAKSWSMWMLMRMALRRRTGKKFTCEISNVVLKLRSFYFKNFHKAIAFNNFLFKINRKDSDFCYFCKKIPRQLFMFFVNVIMLNLFGMILLKLLKISMTLNFLFQTLKRCLEFSRIILLHIYFFVWNTIFMYVNLEAQNSHLLGTQLISRVIEKLNIILPKRGGNFQIVLKNGGLIFNWRL